MRGVRRITVGGREIYARPAEGPTQTTGAGDVVALVAEPLKKNVVDPAARLAGKASAPCGCAGRKAAMNRAFSVERDA